MISPDSASIQALKQAIENKINEIVQTHDVNSLSHEDIRAELDDISDYLVYISEVDINDLIDKSIISATATEINNLQLALLLDDLADEIAKE